MAIGWVTINEADTYFSTRWVKDGPATGNYWVTGINKTALLTTAYNQLVNCGLFTFPETATDLMKYAQYEQALFLLLDEGIDKRSALQSQNVSEAGLIKEKYVLGNGIPICAAAMQALIDTYDTNQAAYLIHLERTEETDEIDA